MTLDEAFKHFVQSKEYKEIARQNNSDGSKYRLYLSRFKNNKLKAGAIVEVLIANGYEIKANKVSKK